MNEPVSPMAALGSWSPAVMAGVRNRSKRFTFTFGSARGTGGNPLGILRCIRVSFFFWGGGGVVSLSRCLSGSRSLSFCRSVNFSSSASFLNSFLIFIWILVYLHISSFIIGIQGSGHDCYNKMTMAFRGMFPYSVWSVQ